MGVKVRLKDTSTGKWVTGDARGSLTEDINCARIWDMKEDMVIPSIRVVKSKYGVLWLPIPVKGKLSKKDQAAVNELSDEVPELAASLGLPEALVRVIAL